MAKTIARAKGEDWGRSKIVSRFGSKSATGEANTFRTFAMAYVRADGSGEVSVIRDGKSLHYFEFDKEE